MCDYCGCQAVTVIRDLTHEHQLIVNLICAARVAHAAANVARMAEVTREISAILDPHTEVEERGLFPCLAADFPDGVADLEREHRQIEAVLAEAATDTPVDPTWPGRLVGVLKILREHIHKEQDGAFPAALTTLRPADWDAVDAVRARASGSLVHS